MAKVSELDVVKAEHSQRMAAANRRYKMENFKHTLVRKGAIVGTAAVYGTLNRLDVPVAIGGFPWKLAVSALALVVEGTTSGMLQATAAGISDSTTAIFTERAISENTLIVGQGRRGGGGDDAPGEV